MKKSIIPRLVCGYIVAAIFLAACATQKTGTTVSSGTTEKDSTENTVATTDYTHLIDSLFTSWKQSLSQSSTTNEQSHERITESITTTIDSLGREIRNEQRTIDRDISKATEERLNQVISQQQTQITDLTHRYDSLFAAMEANYRNHWQDSTHTEKKPVASSYGAHLKHLGIDFILAIVIVALIALAITFVKKWLKSKIKA